MKQKDYIDEFLDYQEHQYSPQTYYPPQGQLPRYLKFGDRRPLGMAVLFMLLIPACIAWIWAVIRDWCGDWPELFFGLVFPIPIMILSILAGINYIRKYFQVKREKDARKATLKAEHKRRKKHKKHG